MIPVGQPALHPVQLNEAFRQGQVPGQSASALLLPLCSLLVLIRLGQFAMVQSLKQQHRLILVVHDADQCTQQILSNCCIGTCDIYHQHTCLH